MKAITGCRLARFALAAVLLAALASGGCGRLKRAAYSPADRDEWQMPERVLAALPLEPGSRVADIGAGGGYFTFRLARAVGPDGTVYAVDVDEDMLAYIAGRSEELGLANIETRQALPDDPNLPDGGIDLVFTSNTYHHLPDRVAYFRGLQRDLAPGGRVAIVEFVETGFFSRVFGHNTEPELIRQEMEAAGYERVADHDFLPRQSFEVFAPASAD